MVSNNNRTDYFNHNGIWVPDNLEVGDIISCRMFSSKKDGRLGGLYSRTVVVLGFQMSPETLAYTHVHVARFVKQDRFCKDGTGLFLSKDMEKSNLVSGIDLPLTLRTDRTDVVPIDHLHFPLGRIERSGKLSPILLSRLNKDLQKNLIDPEKSSASAYAGLNNQHWYVSSIHQALDKSNGENIWSEIGAPFSQLSDYDKAELSRELLNPHRFMDGDAVHQAYLDDLAQRRRRSRPKPKTSLHHHLPRAPLPFPVEADAEENKSSLSAPETESIHPEDKRVVITAGGRQTPSANVIASFFKKESELSRVVLPEHLWQGRYLMTKIPDLMDDENDGLAFRPCAVWKLFADPNSGEPIGMELHPVTRSQADRFSYKLQVYPISTASKNPSFLIADCVVRVPVTTQFFQENTTANFFELPPDKIEKFSTRRDFAMASGSQIHIYGLGDIPSSWEEVNLPPTPSYEQFEKWAQRGQIRFDGNVTNRVREQQRTKGKKIPGQGRRLG